MWRSREESLTAGKNYSSVRVPGGKGREIFIGYYNSLRIFINFGRKLLTYCTASFPFFMGSFRASKFFPLFPYSSISIHLSIFLSIYPYIYLFIYPSTNPSIKAFIYLSIYLFFIFVGFFLPSSLTQSHYMLM